MVIGSGAHAGKLAVWTPTPHLVHTDGGAAHRLITVRGSGAAQLPPLAPKHRVLPRNYDYGAHKTALVYYHINKPKKKKTCEKSIEEEIKGFLLVCTRPSSTRTFRRVSSRRGCLTR